MPFLVLLLISLAAGAARRVRRVALSRRRSSGSDPADAAAEHIETDMERHPWLLRLVRDRLDPATATGLALTLALGLAIVGGASRRGPRVPRAQQRRRSSTPTSRSGSGASTTRRRWSTDALQLVTELGGTYFVVVALVVVAVVEYVRVPNRWVPGLPRDGRGRATIVLVNTIKEHPRPRATDLQSRSPRRSGRRFRADTPASAAAFYAAAALVLARRRSPRTRALLAGGAVAIAVAVACSRVLLGVHWMSDVIAGLAFGWAWFGICAIAFGGRFLVLGAPVEQAAEIAEQRGVASDAPAVRRRRAGSAAGRSGAGVAARRPAASRAGA